MELNDANLQTLTEYLRKTLDPDPAVRRPGNTNTNKIFISVTRWPTFSSAFDHVILLFQHILSLYLESF